ncbi:MAG: YggW family oxidoreductase [Lysobacteraceae bacterium]|nr:MAG: YggW family oxidoreductase [Xanthomonadaceae bacterium]
MSSLGAYIHLPWCVRKCPYCDFNSHTAPKQLPEDPYIDALLGDLEFDLPKVWGRTVSTVFIGGGTPSLFGGDAINRLMEGLRSRLRCAPDMEVTMECNPGTAEYAPFADYRKAGINRLSLGAQSFDDESLQQLGRIHRASETLQAFAKARDAGFDNINLDIMYGLPQQSHEGALHDLRTAISLEPEHVSWYQLTLEPNTLFAANPPNLPDDEALWAMQAEGQAMLAAAGFMQYEVSAYARERRQCRHNMNYWSFGDYLGLGAGAHAKLTQVGVVERTVRQRQPKAYLQAQPEQRVVQRTEPDAAELRFEFMLNAARLTDGFSMQRFTASTGLAAAALEPELSELRSKGLFEPAADGRVVPTELGRRFVDEITAAFLPESS